MISTLSLPLSNSHAAHPARRSMNTSYLSNASWLSGPRPSGNDSITNTSMSSLLCSSGIFPGDVSAGSLSTAASYIGSGISDLRSAVTSQQKQLDGLVDRVAALLSAMHAEMLQDFQVCFDAIGGEQRLAEMKQVGEVLDQRLADIHAEISQQEALRHWVQDELNKLHDVTSKEVDNLTDRLDCLHVDMKEHVSNQCENHHSELLATIQSFRSEVQSLEKRVDGLETEVALLADESNEDEWRQALTDNTVSLREEFAHIISSELHPIILRLNCTEGKLLEDQPKLLEALQQAANAVRIQEEERNHQWRYLEIAQAEAKRQNGDLEVLSSDVAQLRQRLSIIEDDEQNLHRSLDHCRNDLDQSKGLANRLHQIEHELRELKGNSGSDFRKQLFKLEEQIDLIQSKLSSQFLASRTVTSDQRLDELAERLDALSLVRADACSMSQKLNGLEDTVLSRLSTIEKRSESMQKQIMENKEATNASVNLTLSQKSASISESKILQKLQHSISLVVEDLRHQLDTQLKEAQGDASRRLTEHVDLKIDEFKRSMTQRMSSESRKDSVDRPSHSFAVSEQIVNDLRSATESCFQQTKRLRDELRLEIDEKSKHSLSSSNRMVEDLQQLFESQRSQSNSAMQRLTEDVRQLSSDFEIRLAQAQSSMQRVATEIRKDLDSRILKIQALASIQTNNEQQDQSKLNDLQLRELVEDIRSSISETAKEAALETSKKSFTEAARAQTAQWLADMTRLSEKCESSALFICKQHARKIESRFEALAAECRQGASPEHLHLTRRHEQRSLAPDQEVSFSVSVDNESDMAAASTAKPFALSPTSVAVAKLVSSPSTAQDVMHSLASDDMGEGTEKLLKALAKRVTEQEGSLQDLRQRNLKLRSEVDGYQLEKKVTRSLAGLERQA